VKSRIAALFQENPRQIEAVSLNPMFAPSLGMAGRPIAVITLADGPRAKSFLKLVASWGAKLVHLEAADHDRLVASVQAASHLSILAFGLALKELGADVGKLSSLATPPHLTLLALLSRLTSGQPEVYWDIQAGNPDAPAARAALRHGIDRLTAAIERNDPAEFVDLFEEMRNYLQDERGDLSKLCTQIFENLPPTLHSPASE
jgi:prephenate dehydrogenase